MILKISRWLFLLYVLLTPIVEPASFSYKGLIVQYSDVVFAAAAILLSIALLTGQARLASSHFYWIVGFYIAAFLISSIFSADPRSSLLKLTGVIYLGAVAITTLQLVADPDFFRQVVIVWLVATVIIIIGAIAGIVVFYSGMSSTGAGFLLSHLGSLPPGNYPRVNSFFINANMMCNYLNVSFMFALLAAHAQWIGRRLATVLVVGILVAAFFTLSPGLGGLMLSGGLWFWLRDDDRLRRSLGLVTAVLGAVGFLGITLISLDTPNTGFDVTVPIADVRIEPSVRMLIWDDALTRIPQHLFIGAGTGANAAHVEYTALTGQRQLLLDAHNMWLNVTSQAGLFGLAALAALVLYLLLILYRDRSTVSRALFLAFLGAFLYQGLAGSYEDARHLWILFGLIAAVHSRGARDLVDVVPNRHRTSVHKENTPSFHRIFLPSYLVLGR